MANDTSSTQITDEMIDKFFQTSGFPSDSLRGIITKWESFKSSHASSVGEKKAPIQEPTFNWVVFTEDGFAFDKWSAKDWRGGKGKTWNESVKTFITKSEAEEYILLNRPVLSVNDVISVLKSECDGTYTQDYEKWRFSSLYTPSEIIESVKILADAKIDHTGGGK